MAHFKTGKDQRIVTKDVVVVGTVTAGTAITASNREAAILLGDLVKYTPATDTVSAYIAKAKTGAGQPLALASDATHIVALTEQAIHGSVPVELGNYKSDILIGATKSTAPNDLTEPKVRVGLYPIIDVDDVIVEGNDYIATPSTDD